MKFNNIIEIIKIDDFGTPLFKNHRNASGISRDITGNSVMIKFTAPKNRIIQHESKRVTEKEFEVLSLLQDNPSYTDTESADKLRVCRKTVSIRIASLRKKVVFFESDLTQRDIGKLTNPFITKCGDLMPMQFKTVG